MKNKYNQHLPVLLFLAVLIVLAVVLFACETSKNQDMQITNVFTPGLTQSGGNHTLISGSTTNPTEIALATAGATLLPSTLPTMIVTNAQGQPVIVTQTLPAFQANQPTSTRAAAQPNQPTSTRTLQPTLHNPYPIVSATPTRTPTSGSTTVTQTQTATTTLKPGWAGDWMVHLEKAEGAYKTGNVSLEVNGNLLTGSGSIDGQKCTFNGYVVEDNQAEGHFTCQSLTKYFRWTMLSSRQFGGSSDDRFGFCGNRQGADKPEPCRILPER